MGYRMKDRALSQDTKTYNLFQKYRGYKKLITSERVDKYVIFNYPESIDVEGTEKTIKYIIKKEKETLKKNKDDDAYVIEQAKQIQKVKDMYREFYTPDIVNEGTMSNFVFNNIINYGKDAVLHFSIDYDFTKHTFQLTNNNIIFDIQDGMFDFLTKDDNMKKLYELEDEINQYNESRVFILSNTSSSYNNIKKIDKLAALKIKALTSGRDVGLIDTCLDLIKNIHYSSPQLYKAHLLLKKDIINIDTIELARVIIKYSKLK